MNKFKNGSIFYCKNLPDKNDARIGKVGIVTSAIDGEDKYSAAFISGGYSCHGEHMVAVDMNNIADWQKNSLGLLKNAYPHYFESPIDVAKQIEQRAKTVQQMINQFKVTETAKHLTIAQLNELCIPKAEYLTDMAMPIYAIADDLNRRLKEMINEQNKQPEQEALVPEVVENPKINVPAIVDLESEAKTTAPIIIFDKQRYLDAIDAMPIEDITAKWIKSIKDAAIAIDKKLNEPVKAWRAEVDEIIEYVEKRIESLKAAAAKIEADRKAERKIIANQLIAECKTKSDLPPEYLAKVVFKDDYLLVKFTDKKILEDVGLQIETQRALKQGADDALALKQANIKSRELLIENLNLQYGFDGKYSQMPIEMYDDEQVKQLYVNKKAKIDAENAAKLEREAQNVEKENAVETSGSVDTLPSEMVHTTQAPAETTQEILQQFSKTLTLTITTASEKNLGIAVEVLTKMLDDVKARWGDKVKLNILEK